MCFRVPSIPRSTIHLCLAGGLLLTACTDDRAPLAPTTTPDPAKGSTDLVPLSQVPVPQPRGGDIIDGEAAARLGKAFFWDMQTGSDGGMACASCHWKAGADDRPFSQGVVPAEFTAIHPDPEVAEDICEVSGAARQQTGRNSPTVIGAVFNRQNFWDGRANHHFNGVDPFGRTDNANNQPISAIDNASLASQAVGPANDAVEMACAGRPFNGSNSLGSKLLARRPLGKQLVNSTDGVLGTLSRAPEPGLSTTYRELIASAFGDEIAENAENRFSTIWGQALQAYQSTLIADQTPLDRYLAGDEEALTDQQERGLNRFTGKGQCSSCHAGAELSDATFSFIEDEGLINDDGGDQGFHHIGVLAVDADPGRAGTGPKGFIFSESGSDTDRGAVKTPTLRNVALTGPYFHDGSVSTLRDVVDFYARGGDFTHSSSRVQPLSLDEDDRRALVDFMENALTDCRVKRKASPFDHPELRLPDGRTVEAVGREGDQTISC